MAKAVTRTIELRTPDGVAINGTLERLTGVSHITQVHEDDKGKLTLDQNGVDIDWNGQRTAVSANGERLYVCENGEIWLETELVRTPAA
jgi:hypothetical protein